MFSEYFSLEDGYAVFRPEGQFTFDQAVDVIDEALAFCRDNEIRSLLVDITDMTGFPPPTTSQRFLFATRWAATAGGKVAVSVIAPPEMIDNEKIGVLVATNRSLVIDVFTAKSDAIDWLLRTTGRPNASP